MSAVFNPLVASILPPPVPSVFAWARAYDGAKGPAIDLSQAVPGYAPHGDILRWLSEASGSLDYTGYGPIEGETVLRDAYAAHVAAIYGVGLGARNIHITSGCNQAFMCAAMAVAGAGDTVALTNPFYFNQDTTLEMLGIKRVLVGCSAENGFLPKIEDVDAVLAGGVKALAIVTPNNPTGAVYPAQLLADIFNACRKHGAWLILDETYRDFLPPGAERPHDLMKIDGWEDNLIMLYSFSKSYCIPGHRLGAITAGAKTLSEITKIMDNLQICAPRAPQAAVAKAIPALVEWRKVNRLEIAARADALRRVMRDLPQWQLASAGAYFAFVRHPFEGVPSAVVAEKMARIYGVVCLPGSYFGAGQDGFLRFAFANAGAKTIEGLSARLSGFSMAD
ncbi:aminotransferase [Agrobacterium tumefaciens]|uniref:aminotransferase n=1 Tax=Agrobacterium tumefaciens TaxID=358 RepID=UPI00287CE391|nr:aminotransferase [Agrobacterium tumefaciens]MDS7595660.1 aminotransferase [Agrobacterium tumefaciens]